MRQTHYYYGGTTSFGRHVGLHVAVVEKAIGKRLPEGAVVHHADGDSMNNAHENLVVCPDEAYHKLLHRRMRAMDACGNPDAVKCQYCGVWDIVQHMQSVRKNDRPSTTYWHANCRSEYRREFYANRKK